MSTNPEPDTEDHCYAKFIYNHGQKPSLTRVTDSKISSALFRMYPFLIIVDGALSNIMWICDDKCLPFIHLVMVSLVIDTLSLIDPVYSSRTLSFRIMATLWLGIMSATSLLYSFMYYVVTVYQDLERDEPPTLDDIVIVLEALLDKLDTMRKEALSRTLKIGTWVDAFKLAMTLTPLQFVAIKYFSIRDNVQAIVLFCLLYHSLWIQSTLRLFWRVLTTRNIYFAVTSLFGNHARIVHAPLIDARAATETNNSTIFLPYTSNLRKLNASQLKLELQRMYPLNENISDIIVNGPHVVAINEFIIQENQRKWKPHNTWEAKLLSYEKPKFCLEINSRLNACCSPWELQESLSTEWEWLDDCWRPSAWTYFDSNWHLTGSNDSLEAYTRTKVWRRRAFKVSES